MPRRTLVAERDHSQATPGQLKERLLNKLSSRVRTAQQLRQWALQQGYQTDVVEAAIADLQRVQVLDDLAFARAVVRSKPDLAKPELRRRLQTAGVSEAEITVALEERSGSDQEACERVVARLWPRMSKLPFEVAQRRVLNQLKRRGYDFSTAMRALERASDGR
jgi:SOS response regulatory protein OraA/RecX